MKVNPVYPTRTENRICLVNTRRHLIRVVLEDEDYVEWRDIVDAVLNEVFRLEDLADELYRLFEELKKSNVVPDMAKHFIRKKLVEQLKERISIECEILD